MKKLDYPRGVSIHWTPSQANYVAGALTALLLLDKERGPILDNEAGKLALIETVEAIDFQLAQLRWPQPVRRKMEFPV